MFSLFAVSALAQDPDPTELPPTRDVVTDSSLLDSTSRVTILDKFDLLAHRSFLFTGQNPDFAPGRAALSGTWFVGMGYNLFLSRRFYLQFQGGLAFFTFGVEQTPEKTFPSAGDQQFTSERIRAFYVEAPLGAGFTISYDTKGRVETFVEMGLASAMRYSTSFKELYPDPGPLDRNVRAKYNSFPGIRPYRFQLYTRLGYRFVGLLATYRLNRFFNPGETFTRDDGAEIPYPEISRWELGLFLEF